MSLCLHTRPEQGRGAGGRKNADCSWDVGRESGARPALGGSALLSPAPESGHGVEKRGGEATVAAPPQPVWPARPPSLCSAACVHGLRGGPSRSTSAVGRSRERVSASCRGKTRPPAFRSAAWGCAASAFPPGHPGSDTWVLPRIRGVPFPDGFYLFLKGSEKSQIQFTGYFSSFYSPPRAVPRNVRASLLGFSVLCAARGPGRLTWRGVLAFAGPLLRTRSAQGSCQAGSAKPPSVWWSLAGGLCSAIRPAPAVTTEGQRLRSTREPIMAQLHRPGSPRDLPCAPARPHPEGCVHRAYFSSVSCDVCTAPAGPEGH